MKAKNASISDVLAIGVIHDCCVVLPTLDHAWMWWPSIVRMFEDRQPCEVTKTAIYGQKTNTIIRLWVPYEPHPVAPMDFIHPFVFRAQYLDLYGLYGRDVKWL